MLTEWYFCCCIDANPANTNIFLHIWQEVQDPESDQQNLSAAIGELQRGEIWMQLYLFPEVLGALHREDLGKNSRIRIEDYCRGLLEFLPAENRSLFWKLLTSAYFDYAITTAEQIKACARYLSQVSEHSVSERPYLDLPDFIGETILMAVIADLIQHDRHASPKVASALKDSDQLRSSVDRALAHKCGRLAFRLAARIAQLTGMHDERALENLCNKRYCTPELEPDLMHMNACLKFTEVLSGGGQPNILTNKIIHEITTLSELNRIALSNSSRAEKWSAVQGRFGYTTDIGESLSIVFWQTTLWQLASEAEDAAKALAKYWNVPGVIRHSATVSTTFPREKANRWLSQMQLLVKLRRLATKIEPKRQGRKDLDIPGRARWMLFSPWVGANHQRSKPGEEQEEGRYPTAIDPIVLIRILVTAVISRKVLQRLPIDDPQRVVFGQLIVHASSVLSTYDYWLKKYDELKDDKKARWRQELPLTGLMLFTRDQIALAGRGRIEAISPDFFVEMLQRDPTKDPARDPEQISLDERVFYRSVLPEVLLSWVADAYTGASDSSGPGRWQKHIEGIHSFYKLGRHDEKSAVEAASVMRFLASRPEYVTHGSLDWRRELDPHYVKPRKFLLTPLLSVEEWARRIRGEFRKGYKRDRGLHIATERLAALRTNSEYEYAAQWRNDWIEAMNRINTRRDLDRFMRLRLIELLEGDELELRDHELITLVLVEWGVYNELMRMFDAIYFPKGGTSQQKKDLGEFLTTTIYRYIEASSQAQQERLNPGHLQHIRFEIDRLALMNRVLARLAFMNRADAVARVQGTLGNLLIELEQAALRQRLTQETRVTRALLERHGDRNVIIAADAEAIQPWMIKGITFDPNSHDLTIATTNLKPQGVTNLFGFKQSEYEAFLDNKNGNAHKVLAVVVKSEPGSESDDSIYTFNCGLPRYVESPCAHAGLPPGTHVALPILKLPPKDGKPAEWRVPRSRVGEIVRLRPQTSAGDLIEVKVKEVGTDPVTRTVKVFYEGTECSNSAERRDGNLFASPMQWDGNLSAAFQEPRPEYPCFASVDPQRAITPIDGSLTTLILEGLLYSDSSVAVLTLLDREVGAGRHEKAWRFSTGPGANFLLASNDFAPEDAARLDTVVSQHREPRGLILTVAPVLENDRVLLRRVSDKVQDQKLDVSYPELETPFDLRNLKWRALFSQGQAFVATRDKGWTVRVPNRVRGFPEKVEVVWQKGNPSERFREVEFEVESWDPRTAVVTGSYVQQESLHVPPADYDRFLSYWLDPPKWSSVELTRVIPPVYYDGYVRCLTKEGMVVGVDADSLTMEPVDERLNATFSQTRMAEVYRDAEWILIRDKAKRPLFPLVEVNQLAPVIKLGRCSGLLFKVPKEVGNRLYEVLWNVDGKAVLLQLRMDLKIEQPVPAGSRITGELTGDGWNWKLERLSLRCRALWRLDANTQQSLEKCSYLGIAWINNREQPIVQVRPGQLGTLPSAPAVNHLARRDGEFFKDLSVVARPARNESTNFAQWIEDRMKLSRAVLRLEDRTLLGGYFLGGRPKGTKLAIDDVNILVRPRANGYYRLERILSVSEIPEETRTAMTSPVAIKDDWQKRLDAYFLYPLHDSKRTLDATIAGTTARITDASRMLVPKVGQATGGWTDTVELPQGEFPYIPSTYADYSRTDARIVLCRYEASGKIYGSCRRVPPLSVDEYRSAVVSEPGRFHSLKEPLFYIGPERTNPLTDQKYAETHHRFEYGAGKMLVAPESRLRFEEGPFATSRYLLNSGDRITGITFREFQGDLVIDVSRYAFNTKTRAIDAMPRSQLYEDRKNRIVHTLHVVAYPDELRLEVEYVSTFDHRGNDKLWPHAYVNPVLSSEDKTLILSQLSQREDIRWSEGVAQFKVLGRLDMQRFGDDDNRGKEVLFKYVRLTFDSEDDRSLHAGERIFLMADGVEKRLTNDFALILTWANMIDPIDVGPEFQHTILLLRRDFSVRENRLERIYASAGSAELIDRKFLVQVTPYKDKVGCSLIAEPVVRTADVLENLIKLSGPQIGTVSQADALSVEVELKPGLFCKVSRSEIQQPHPVFNRRTTIKVDLGGDWKFLVTLAAYSDIRYVPKEGRLGLALPKSHLFRKVEWLRPELLKDRYWSRRENFSIGGLPNVTPQAGVFRRDRRTWDPGHAEDCIRLMEMRHPTRIVLFDRERFMPVTNNKSVGRLQLAANVMDVYYSSLNEPVALAESPALSWRFLTFADQPVSQVLSRIDSESWEYHDSLTVTISVLDGEPHIDRYPTGKHTGWTGPLFFEMTDGQARLRYTRAKQLQYCYPVEELVLSLAGKKNKGSYVVAGVPDEGGLMIELAPGRVAELPPNIIVGQRRDKEFDLDKMNWSAFAPGDIVELESTSRNPLLVDRILLRQWKPGARSAFGRARALLPVVNRDVEHGSLTLGHGEFTVTIPDANPHHWEEVVGLYPTNRIEQAADLAPTNDDVVLLGLNESLRPIVIGFPELVPEADTRPALVREDQLASAYLQHQVGGLTFNRQGLRRLITDVAGVLPVTVEYLKPLGNGQTALVFSRRHQQDSTAKLSGRITYASIIGFQADDNSALLRCGGDILKVKMSQIISGIPGEKDLLWEAVNTLRSAHTQIPLHMLADGRIQAGLPRQAKQATTTQILIRPIHPISGDQPAGLICQDPDSLRFYWLPASDAAWTGLSAEELQALFRSGQSEYLRAAVRPNGAASIVHTAAALKEFESFRIGKQLAVTMKLERLASETGQAVWVGQSFSSKVMLECTVEDHPPMKKGQAVAMEVVSYAVLPYRVKVTPVGNPKRAMDLPGWMVPLMKPGARAGRPEFKEYLRWRKDSRETPVDKHGLEELLVEQLNRLLVQVYETLDDSSAADGLRIRVARAWKQQNEKGETIDLAFGIMAVLLMERMGVTHNEHEWRVSARELAQNLAGRSLRSLHVEPLYRRWISKAGAGTERRADLWNRLRQVMGAIDPPSNKTLQAIRQFSRAIKLRSITEDSYHELREIRILSECLSAMAGDFSEGLLTDKLEADNVTRSLALIHQTLPNMKASTAIVLDPTHVQKLEELLTDINQSPLDVTLLDNLVALEMRSRTGRG